MKLNLIYGIDADNNQCVVGWNFTAENEQEEYDLSVVRDRIFFGIDDTYPVYAGRTDDPKTELVQKIWYRIPEFANRISKGDDSLEVKDAEARSMLESYG